MITDALQTLAPFLFGLVIGGMITFAVVYLVVFHGGIELRTPEEQRISDLAMSADHARTIRKLSPLPKDWEQNHEILRANDRIRRAGR